MKRNIKYWKQKSKPADTGVDSMLYQKTNEDYNKEKPDLINPLQVITIPAEVKKKGES